MSPRIGEHIITNGNRGVYVPGNNVIVHRNDTLIKESFDSPTWRNYEVYAGAFCDYHVMAEELYQQYGGKYYSPVGGFINDIINKTHAKSGLYQALGYATVGVGSSMVTAGVESLEIVSNFVSRGDNIVTQTARAVAIAPIAVAFTVIKSPVFLISKMFNW